MVKAGQYKGKQYGIPEDWGYDAVLYRSDKVKPKARSWGLLFDERYKGKIAWYDDASTMLPVTGLYLGFKDPWNQTDAQLKQAQKFLVSKKRFVRTIWSSETALWQAFGSGDLWIAYAWPNDWVQMRKKPKPGLPVVYMFPRRRLSPGSACSCSSRTRRARSSRTRTSMPGARPRAGSGWRTTTATVTRTFSPSRPRATSCVPSSSATRRLSGQGDRVHRPPHPTARRLREGLGRGEVGLRGSSSFA